MYAIINHERLPNETLRLVMLCTRDRVKITGQITNELQLVGVYHLIRHLHEGSTIEFEVNEHRYNDPYRGIGVITKIEVHHLTEYIILFQIRRYIYEFE